MKIRLLLLLILLFWHKTNAQIVTNEQQNIVRNWIKYRIEMKDGSQVLNESIVRNAASMLVFKKGNIGVIINGKNAQQTK